MRKTNLSKLDNKLFYISILNSSYTNMVYLCCKLDEKNKQR